MVGVILAPGQTDEHSRVGGEGQQGDEAWGMTDVFLLK